MASAFRQVGSSFLQNVEITCIQMHSKQVWIQTVSSSDHNEWCNRHFCKLGKYFYKIQCLSDSLWLLNLGSSRDKRIVILKGTIGQFSIKNLFYFSWLLNLKLRKMYKCFFTQNCPWWKIHHFEWKEFFDCAQLLTAIISQLEIIQVIQQSTEPNLT